MTQDEIVAMAREAGFEDFDKWAEHYPQETKRWCERMEAFANLVAQKVRDRIMFGSRDDWVLAEREACAKLCDLFQARDVGMQPAECAGAIRARGEA